MRGIGDIDIVRRPGTDAPTLRIGDLAERTGLTPRAIRYYEEVGLLPAPGRTEGDYRLYSERDVERLLRIVRLRDLLGFSLAEVGEILRAEETLEELKSQYRATEDEETRLAKLESALAVVEGQISLVERKVAQLLEMKADLEGRLARYREKRRGLRAGGGRTAMKERGDRN